MDFGKLHLYTGNGKGKTTAAFGLAVRASGHGYRTYIGQFLKNQIYGEVKALKNNPMITVELFGAGDCIAQRDITDEDYRHAKIGLEKCEMALHSSSYHIVVMDEICIAINKGLLKETDVLKVILNRPHDTELILTGRYAPKSFMRHADLITEMQATKHYYNTEGLISRKGIEC